ncbi:putative DNA binding domain-containing protein [Nostoc sp. FACHB-87]|uniref:RNA-binding domain-containing protein n=1 Tax=Nostocales TaxID=1161 RepID=UPI001685A4EA|nr:MULTISPECIES: RNA-binding domain-containing protein [Nostocales]MBD2300432.1 putative DNA binding domain-containing protein [Nostoc sp. FACHB-190]MBD2453667.1 putative DNA binding domain-containing protein [Nostoc sp. FACHB-87]MBD2475378.1 putative DNA binding domain-containing protein [Anabaena sp. FACHB-83]MBD2489827.1 putative DNA binding domain-containing protein [Aulosira sp. FACHB-615]
MQTENVHLLVVEDNPRYLSELLEWLGDYGYQHIETATSSTQAQEKLQTPFDVIISDMRMEQDDSGFVILNEVKERNLSSVVIILTANDTVGDCRTAFKSGVWDYISKNMRGNVYDVLHESIQDAIAYFNLWGNAQNEQWITENLETLEQNYFGQYIAVINKTVIDAADTEEALKQRIEERQLRRFLTTIRKIGDLRPISELIQLPESDRLEYKSTFQWDVKRNCENKDLRFSSLKTIVAFLNSEGGTLIIGVEDNGNVFGLEQDLSLLSNGNLDKLERTIIDTICNHIGKSFIQQIKIRFENIDDKCVCAIDVKKSHKKAWLQKTKEKKLEFYIRMSNKSEPLDIPDIYDHL